MFACLVITGRLQGLPTHTDLHVESNGTQYNIHIIKAEGESRGPGAAPVVGRAGELRVLQRGTVGQRVGTGLELCPGAAEGDTVLQHSPWHPGIKQAMSATGSPSPSHASRQRLSGTEGNIREWLFGVFLVPVDPSSPLSVFPPRMSGQDVFHSPCPVPGCSGLTAPVATGPGPPAPVPV